MPEINPYEAPQTQPGSNSEEQLPVEQLPSSLGRTLWLQMAAMVATAIFSFLVSGPLDHLMIVFMQFFLGVAGLLSLWNLISAIRYRIGWLIILELIIIGLPLMLVLPARMR